MTSLPLGSQLKCLDKIKLLLGKIQWCRAQYLNKLPVPDRKWLFAIRLQKRRQHSCLLLLHMLMKYGCSSTSITEAYRKEGFLEKMTLFVSEKQFGGCLRQVWDMFSLLTSIMWLVNSSFGKTGFHVKSSLIEIAACLLFEKNKNKQKKATTGFNHNTVLIFSILVRSLALAVKLLCIAQAGKKDNWTMLLWSSS